MELLIKTSDNAFPGDETEDKKCYKQGMLVLYKPNGAGWALQERNIQKFVIVKTIDFPSKKACIAIKNGINFTRRNYVMPLANIFSVQDLIDLKAGNLTGDFGIVDFSGLNLTQLMAKIEIFDYDNRPEEFGINW